MNDSLRATGVVVSGAAEMMHEVVKIGEPEKAARALLVRSVEAIGADSGRIYRLNVSKSVFDVMSQRNRKDEKPEIDLVRIRDQLAGNTASTQQTCVLEQVICSQRPQLVPDIEAHGDFSRWHRKGAQSRIVVPIVREGLCVGLLDFDSDKQDSFRDEDISILEVAAGVAALLFEKHEAMQLLKATQKPVDFHQPWNEFIDELILVTAEAIQMPYMALREWDGENRLECIGHYGFGNVENSLFDLEPMEEVAPFYKAVTERITVVESDIDKPDLDILRANPALKDVKSFVVTPVLLGDDVFGTLSAAAECPYTYTELEKDGLLMAANSIGIAISNFRNVATREERVTQLIQVGAALTSIEVAQAARHEARNYLSQAALLATNICMLCNVQGRIDRKEVLDKSEGLAEHLKDASQALDKIKSITKPPERDLQQVSLRELWRDTFDLVRARLAELTVIPNIDGADVQIEAYPDHLRHAFLNLVLNSIDAFKNLRRRKGRQIRVYIERTSEAGDAVRMRYVDTATGIDQAGLRPTKPEGIRPVQDVFEPGVTSKKDGSGFGLHLVRQIMDDHHGSVDIRDWRNGVTFEIQLPKRQK